MRATVTLLSAALLVLLALSAQAAEPHWGRLLTVRGDIPVRETPADSALKVRVLKPGQKVRVDFQDEGWAAVFDPKEPVRSELRALGYARTTELKAKGGLELAQVTSIEVKRGEKPEAKPEVKVDGKPDRSAKPAKADKPEAKAPKPKDFGELRVADRQLTVRAARDKDSEFVRVLKAGQRVRVDYLDNGWYAVFDPAEKLRDLKRAWGYSRDKYLVPEAAFKGPVEDATSKSAPAPAPAAAPAPKPAPAPAAAPAPPAAPAAPAKGQKPKAEHEDDAVGYAVLERKDDHHKPVSNVTLRVRLDMPQPPPQETLRKIAREIWKAERKKDENLLLEIYFPGMDPQGLAYAVARFHDDGRLREFWWRDVVLGKGKK